MLLVIWALVICLICMPSALGPTAFRFWAYISGKSLVPMLQLLRNTLLLAQKQYNELHWSPMHFDYYTVLAWRWEHFAFCNIQRLPQFWLYHSGIQTWDNIVLFPWECNSVTCMASPGWFSSSQMANLFDSVPTCSSYLFCLLALLSASYLVFQSSFCLWKSAIVVWPYLSSSTLASALANRCPSASEFFPDPPSRHPNGCLQPCWT